ncbi:MAG: PEFG-CTERM sorting domain-containing protein [Nitrosopumilaceae archaeon]
MRISLVIPVMLAISITIMTAPAFAISSEEAKATAQQQFRSMEISTDKSDYDHASIITLRGYVKYPSQDKPVTIVVKNPIGNVVTIDQIPVDSNGQFTTTINTASKLMKQDGTYTIKAQYQSGVSDEVQVSVVPEFGSIAAMILVIAVVAIIVASAKTRLNFIPRY